ncbi:MAG: DUF882 domain-containing protein [Pseudomonadota bacterium]
MLVAPTDAANERAISFYNIHTRENLTIVYKRNGKYIKSALEKLNWFLRDWRANVPTKMDPKLFDLLADIHRELGSERPIHVISGFRSPKTNAMLRRTRGGQARRSFHMLGKAIDVHFPDVPVRQLRYSALVRQVGGVGYYQRRRSRLSMSTPVGFGIGRACAAQSWRFSFHAGERATCRQIVARSRDAISQRPKKPAPVSRAKWPRSMTSGATVVRAGRRKPRLRARRRHLG